MKKLYISKIIHYSLDGIIINEFNKIQDATHVVNYDSIINCCKGKYKTAGGFIWRFENDPFILNSEYDKNKTITCSICQSRESIRSMAMHLNWVHSINTEDYILKYGEFRPKKLKQQQIKSTSELKCEICNQQMMHNRQLMYHLTKSHPEINKYDYIVKHMLNDNIPLCKCGCENPVTILTNGKNCDLDKDLYHRDYIKNHWDWEVFSNIGKQSKEEIQLLEYIKEIYTGEIQINIRGIIPKSEIDIYLPELKLGIEYNGLYWHSEKNNKLSNYHLNKTTEANKIGIRLIHIFSDEWLNKKNIVKSKLKSIITKNKENTIFARKCTVKEIDPQTKNIFLNEYHIQGEDKSQIKLGLFYNDVLSAIMTFSKPRLALGGKSNYKNIYELSRYASSQYIVGGGDKLIKYFTKTYNPKSIYSYSDNRWTDPNNNMYLKMGFKIEKTSTPNYFYTKNYLVRIHRYNFNKFNLKKIGADITKTEHKIMEEMGYTKIWDCGTTKYILDLF